MQRVWYFALVGTVLILGGGLVGQEPKKAERKSAPSEPEPRVKGTLPQHWGKIGLSDEQKQEIYKIQGKYHRELDKLEAQVKELKSHRDREIKSVLTPEQKKRLEDIVIGKNRDTPKK